MSTSPLPGDSSNDPTDDQTGRFVVQPNGRVRPLSPHLQVWRFHITMLGSILNRFAAGALSVGALFVAAWLAALAFGADAYAAYAGIMGSPVGLLVWFGVTCAAAYHFTAGLRHLVWDLGEGLTPRAAETWTWVSLAAALVIVLAFWGALFASGKVVL